MASLVAYLAWNNASVLRPGNRLGFFSYLMRSLRLLLKAGRALGESCIGYHAGWVGFDFLGVGVARGEATGIELPDVWCSRVAVKILLGVQGRNCPFMRHFM